MAQGATITRSVLGDPGGGTMKISSLTDSQLEMVWRAAAPLQRVDQHSFLARVAELLTAEPELGDGVVYRAVRAAQKDYWEPPERIRHL